MSLETSSKKVSRRTVIVAAMGTIVTLPGCAAVDQAITGGPPTTPLEMRIEASTWSGWERADPNDPPQVPDVTVIDVKKGATARLTKFSKKWTLSVTRATDRNVEFRTDVGLSEKKPGKGISLSQSDHQWSVDVGSTITLMTPTMDAGETYTISVREKS